MPSAQTHPSKETICTEGLSPLEMIKILLITIGNEYSLSCVTAPRSVILELGHDNFSVN